MAQPLDQDGTTQPPSPASNASAPKPWLSRAPGECAFPMDGEGWTLRACCNPCGPGIYCQAHRAVMRGPPGASAESMERALRRFIGGPR